MRCCLLAASVAAALASPVYFVADLVSKEPPSVTVRTGASRISPGPSTAAWGIFNDSIVSTGWSTLDVHTSPAFSDALQAYAAGFAEGVVTQQVCEWMRRGGGEVEGGGAGSHIGVSQPSVSLCRRCPPCLTVTGMYGCVFVCLCVA
jgi:hypothetical protein